MNSVVLVGRLTRDPDIRYSQGAEPMCIARFTVAVDRRFNREKQEADFISCLAFGKTGQFVEKYFHKGNRICLSGRIQTGSYKNKDGNTVYTTDVIAEAVEFVENKPQQGYQTPQQGYQQVYQPQQPAQQYQPQPQYQPQQQTVQQYSTQQPMPPQAQQQYPQQSFMDAQNEGFMNVPPLDDEGLPFN